MSIPFLFLFPPRPLRPSLPLLLSPSPPCYKVNTCGCNKCPCEAPKAVVMVAQVHTTCGCTTCPCAVEPSANDPRDAANTIKAGKRT